jgi:hypothetical protein
MKGKRYQFDRVTVELSIVCSAPATSQGLLRQRTVQGREPQRGPILSESSAEMRQREPQGRSSRDAAASTIHVHPRSTASARQGCFFAATVREPAPVPRYAQVWAIVSWTLGAQSARPLCPAVTEFKLVCTVLGSQPIAALGSWADTP